jgi:hypothetical protein
LDWAKVPGGGTEAHATSSSQSSLLEDNFVATCVLPVLNRIPVFKRRVLTEVQFLETSNESRTPKNVSNDDEDEPTSIAQWLRVFLARFYVHKLESDADKLIFLRTLVARFEEPDVSVQSLLIIGGALAYLDAPCTGPSAIDDVHLRYMSTALTRCAQFHVTTNVSEVQFDVRGI